jgi:hypothetical protein
MNIEESNTLIAEFMGYKFHSQIPIKDYVFYTRDPGIAYDYIEKRDIVTDEEMEFIFADYAETEKYLDSSYIEIKNLKYHSSWDWLMPVVKKIRSTEEFNSIIVIPEDFGDNNMIAGLYTQDIDKVYKGVVEFIQWYNKNKK